ncbi:MAG: hypothetical protein ACRCTJ_04325, partial [Brevinema sp.]
MLNSRSKKQKKLAAWYYWYDDSEMPQEYYRYIGKFTERGTITQNIFKCFELTLSKNGKSFIINPESLKVWNRETWSLIDKAKEIITKADPKTVTDWLQQKSEEYIESHVSGKFMNIANALIHIWDLEYLTQHFYLGISRREDMQKQPYRVYMLWGFTGKKLTGDPEKIYQVSLSTYGYHDPQHLADNNVLMTEYQVGNIVPLNDDIIYTYSDSGLGKASIDTTKGKIYRIDWTEKQHYNFRKWRYWHKTEILGSTYIYIANIKQVIQDPNQDLIVLHLEPIKTSIQANNGKLVFRTNGHFTKFLHHIFNQKLI